MDCSSIDVDYDSGDGTVTMLKDKMVTARKEHKCHECRAIIPKGEQYKLHVYRWDGRFEEHKTCIGCLSIIKEMFSGCYMFGATWEELENHVDEMAGDISEQCLISLHPRARNKLCDIIEAYHERNEDDEED